MEGFSRIRLRKNSPHICGRDAGRVKSLNAKLVLPAAITLLLNGRTLDRTKRTEYAAVTWIGAQQGLAVAALIEKLAGVRRHGLLLGKAAVRTSQHGFKDNSAHRGITSVR
jgi:hypothetical protein